MIDILVVGVYFIFLIAIGFLFKSFTKSTSDYFRGGGKMLWWMVGSTAFMTQFSAWTFTGAAGKAFTDGWSVAIIFFANALGYFMNYLFFAEKSRQMRVVTPIEGIRQRFGKLNEQVFTWGTIPASILQAGIWLNGLAIFTTAVFGVEMEQTIILTGIVVLIMSVTGGSWAVVASDFVQMIIIMVVTFISTVVAVFKAGGVGVIFEKGMPENAIAGTDVNYWFLFVAWFICIFTKQFFSTNNMIDSYRYICAKDSKNAKKAALLACLLMAIGPIMWFMPAWFVAAYYPDTATWGVTGLGNKIKDATYLVFMRKEMPIGMVGLMMSAMFAATMSSMDSALNRNAGIFVKNFYTIFIDKNISDKKALLVSKVATLVFGVIIIGTGLFLNSLKHLSLFNAMMYVGTLISFPLLIPALLGFFIRKTPDWAAWGTVLVGIIVSYCVSFVIKPSMIENLFNLVEPLSKREVSDLTVTLGIIGHIFITGGFFIVSQFFYKRLSKEREKEIRYFFSNVETPVISDEFPEETDYKQRMILGRLIQIFGMALSIMCLIPKDLNGKIIYISMSIIMIVIGSLLVKAGKYETLPTNDLIKE
ncbi:sodium:solute symporter family transporter [Cetobacterium sp.]|uniref:sodium:solute symporter family transporter n=2 Tax=Cetobacterium sp. TaxID=2071632 RepID=UPI003F3F571C